MNLPNNDVIRSSTRLDKWDHRMLGLAEHIAGWSKDPSTRVGCVLADSRHRVVSTGYNGLPQGVRDTLERLEDRALKLMLTLHAEENALLFATQKLDGCTCYVWPMPPCARCAGKLIQAGIARVVAPAPTPEQTSRWSRDFDLAHQMYAEAGVVVDYSE